MPSDKLKPSLSATFNAIIWKIEIDEENNIIALETRDSLTHSASFSAYNFVTGQCYFKEQTTENSWWWGLDRAHDGLIYLHGYKTEGMPEHRGIIAWDAFTGTVSWQQFNYTFDGVSNRGLIVHNPLIQPVKHELLSPGTGELIKNIIPDHKFSERKIWFPAVYKTTMPLPDFVPADAVQPILFLDYNDKSCWSFHVRDSSGLTQKLVIADKNELILSENLASGIQKLNPEAFFIQKNHLFCIRSNNYEITSYLI